MHRFACGVLLALSAALAAGQPLDRLGAVGDSLTDEYFEADYDYARNWTILLVDERGLTFGPTAAEAGQPGGTWGEPRRTGYEDNWARSGATIDDALATGQHLGVADGAVNRGVSHVVVNIGVNDFIGDAYAEIYDGNWTQAQIDAWITQRTDHLGSIVDTILPTGAGVVLLSLLDPGVAPLTQSLFPDPVAREAAALALAQWRDAIRDLAAVRNLVFLDQFAFGRAVFGTHLAPRTILLVGNVEIDLTAADTPTGADPTAAFVHDFFHPNTVLQAIAATLVSTALNLGFATGIAPLSEEEMLGAAGIPYGGSDTLEGEIGPLSGFVTAFDNIFSDGFETGDTSAWSVTVP
ncbi:MAG: SGNH/GDSL hydrolase family protein [Acidobacteria bacterium]|nr:SGNH/GDSL hydrolase family protein [Acidobacteriota bacterium]